MTRCGQNALAIVAVAAFGLGGLVGAGLAGRAARRNRGARLAATRRPVWTEVAWPFPMDQWGKGKAFRCTAADCGAEVTLYIRAKIGFCNCTTGVSDDEELDRISDFDLIGGKLRRAGRRASRSRSAWMKGRSRAYALAGSQSRRQVCAIDRLQRPLRRDRRDCRARVTIGRRKSSRT